MPLVGFINNILRTAFMDYWNICEIFKLDGFRLAFCWSLVTCDGGLSWLLVGFFWRTLQCSLCIASYYCMHAVGSSSLRHDLAGKLSEATHVTGGELTSGGRWRPSWCIARHRVAVLVAYRKRERDLMALLKVLHQILRRQLLDYTIFVIQQVLAWSRDSFVFTCTLAE